MPAPQSLAVSVLAVVAVVGMACGESRSQQAGPIQPPPEREAATSESKAVVLVHTVSAAPLVERLATTGTLRANEQIVVTSEIAGKVARIGFAEGARVSAGQVLVQLDATELTAQRDRASYRLDLASRREVRQKELLDDGLVSPQDYDFVRTELDVLRAELAQVEAALEKTQIRAPFGGVVGLRFVSPGAYVTPQTRITTLQDLDPIKVDFAVPERYVDRIGVGDRVELGVAGLEQRFDAEVYAIEPAVDQATRSLVVRARRPNADGRLRPGSFADVQVVITEVPEALAVPSVAVVPELGGKRVLVVEDGVVAVRQVETGIRTDTEVEVTSGLSVGDRVVVGGLERVKPGDPVEAQEAG